MEAGIHRYVWLIDGGQVIDCYELGRYPYGRVGLFRTSICFYTPMSQRVTWNGKFIITSKPYVDSKGGYLNAGS